MRGMLVDEKHGVLFFYNNIGVQRLADDAPRLLPERDRILLRRRVRLGRLGLFRCSGRCLFQLGFDRHSRFFRLRRSKRRKRSFLRLFGGRLRRSRLRLDPGLAAAEKRSLKVVREHADRPCRTRSGCRAERGGRFFGTALRSGMSDCSAGGCGRFGSCTSEAKDGALGAAEDARYASAVMVLKKSF